MNAFRSPNAELPERVADCALHADWRAAIALMVVLCLAPPGAVALESALGSAPESGPESAPESAPESKPESKPESAALCTEPQRQLLSTLAALPGNSWWLASRNRFESVWTPPALRPLNSGAMTTPASLITAWGGFAWDQRRSALWLFGGGHADYSGNDVYVWYAADGHWQRASLPSEIKRVARGIDTAVDGVDHAPAAAHSYDNNVYLPRLDRLLSFGGAAYNNGGAWRRLGSDGKAYRTVSGHCRRAALAESRQL